jgi:hypothetical protein
VTDISVKETKLHRRFLNGTSFYKVQDLFYKTDTLYDLLKGFAQMIYGKIDKDDNRRKISLYTPYEFMIGGDTIEGYYKKEVSTLTRVARVEVNSNDAERKRYLNLSFAESKEKVVKELYPEDDDKYLEKYGLHGLFVDYGDKYEKSVEKFQNQYFVPTYTPENTFHMCPIAAFEEGTYKNKGRRIVFALGDVNIGITELKQGTAIIRRARNVKVKFWKNENEFKNPFWAFQSINEEVYTLTEANEFFHLAFSTKKTRPDYEDKFKNLYDLIIKEYAINLVSSQGGTVWKYMPSTEFNSFDKRKQYNFNVKDYMISCYILQIEGYRPCDLNVVGLKFLIGDRFRKEPETTSTPPTYERPYDEDLDFTIVVTKSDCTYYITLEYA